MKTSFFFKSLLFLFFLFFSCKQLEPIRKTNEEHLNVNFISLAKKALKKSGIHPSFKKVDWDFPLTKPIIDKENNEYRNFKIQVDLNSKETLCTIITFIRKTNSNQIEIYPWKGAFLDKDFKGKFYSPAGKFSHTYKIKDYRKYRGYFKEETIYHRFSSKGLYNGNEQSSSSGEEILRDYDDSAVVVRGNRGQTRVGDPFAGGGFAPGYSTVFSNAMGARNAAMAYAQEEFAAREHEAYRIEMERLEAERKKIELAKKTELRSALDYLLSSTIKLESGSEFSTLIHLGNESDPPYEFLIRSFGPTEFFGLSTPAGFRGEFHGDNRGFITDPNVSARIHQTILIDEDYKVRTYARCDDAKLDTEAPLAKFMHSIPFIGTNFNKPNMPAIARAEVTEDLKADIQQGYKIVSLATSVKASNPYLDLKYVNLAPDIKVYCDLSIKDDGSSLEIKARLRGTDFPATEMFLKDSEGLLFTAVGFYEGSPWSLLGSAFKDKTFTEMFQYKIFKNIFEHDLKGNPIMTSHIKYKDKDARGAYRSVELVESGKTYTREQWNEMIQILSPYKNELKKRLKQRQIQYEKYQEGERKRNFERRRHGNHERK